MTERTSPDQPDPDQPIESVVDDTVDPDPDPTTRREGLELELGARDRSDEGAEVEITDVVDDPDD